MSKHCLGLLFHFCLGKVLDRRPVPPEESRALGCSRGSPCIRLFSLLKASLLPKGNSPTGQKGGFEAARKAEI